ncbi:MAG: DUF4199 domain-containing protein [Bacteroidetes bacterium]|nr:DUF4199 domain-containing protein [Bacteroidota bacterium]
MENETKQQGMLKPALQYGLILSLALIMLSLIFYLIGEGTNKWASWLSYPLFIGILVFSIIKHRDEENDGFITYGKSLGFGTLIGVFTGIIYAVYAFIFFKFIAPELQDILVTNVIIAAETYSPNMTIEQIDFLTGIYGKLFSPIGQFIVSLFGKIFLCFVFSLIISIFTKKKNPELL